MLQSNSGSESLDSMRAESELCRKPDVDPKFIAQFPSVEQHTRLFKHDLREKCQNTLPNKLDSLQASYKCINTEYNKVYAWCCPYWVIMSRKEEGVFDQFFKVDSPFKVTPAQPDVVASFAELQQIGSTYGASSDANERKVMLEKVKDTFDMICEQKMTLQKERAFCLGKSCTYVVDGLYRVLHAIGEQIKDAAALGRDHPLNNQI